MTNQDQPEFYRRLAALHITLAGKEIPDVVAQTYFGVLERFDLEQVVAALNQALATCQYFPRPVELLEMIQGKPEERALQAWAELKRIVHKYGAMHSVVIADNCLRATIWQLGGWVEVCDWTPDDWTYRQKDFIALYAFHMGAGIPKNTPVTLLGVTEQLNQKAKDSFPDYEIPIYPPKLIGEGAARLLERSRQERLLGEKERAI